MSIADSYRAMSEDIRRESEAAEHEDVRRAYLALAEMWASRAAQLESARFAARRTVSERLGES